MKRSLIFVISMALLFSCSGPEQKSDVSINKTLDQQNADQPQASAAAEAGQSSSGVAQAEAATKTETTTQPEEKTVTATGSAGTSSAGTSSAGTSSAGTSYAKAIGELVYAHGNVSVLRAGGKKEAVDIGDVVRPFDILMTGQDSRAEIDIASGKAGGSSIKLAENTIFYFDTKELDDKSRKTAVQLLGGSIAVKVDRLAGGSFNVASDETVLGVRGTVFYVDSIADGSMLLSCFEGLLAVTTDNTKSFAEAGQAVSKMAGELPRTTQPGTQGLNDYRTAWNKDSMESYARLSIGLIDSYSAVLDNNKTAFDKACKAMLAREDILKTWRDERAAGKAPRFTDYITEKKTMAALLFDCLEGLFIIEKPYYKLVTMKAIHDKGIGKGQLKSGKSSTEYFGSFEASTQSLAVSMAKVREALDLFNWASAGSPLGEFFGSKADRLGSGKLFLGDNDF
ncbi:hypothetical protein MASR2M29_11130 [Spirochaetota bacterium]